METRKTPLEADRYYHIYNRGINGQNIFLEEKNYSYFLSKYAQYVSPLVDTYAYCLLGNHFHVLIKSKSEEDIRIILNRKKEEKSISWHLSNAFASLFQSYAQAINKRYNRTGTLFEEPFRRIEVAHDAHFSELIRYIHYNPQKHGFTDDFRDYPHSSYHSFIAKKQTKLDKNQVLNWFGNQQAYIDTHTNHYKEVLEMDAFIIEYD